MKKNFLWVYSIALASLFSEKAMAQFPVGDKRILLAPTYSYYRATGYWNSNSIYSAYPSGGKFTSNYLGLYGVAGINRNWEFTFNVPFIVQTYTDSGRLIQNGSLGDVTLGLTYYTPMADPQRHFSITGSLIIPLYQNIPLPSNLSTVTPPFVGFQTTGGELKLSYAGSTENVWKSSYYTLQGALRQYFSTYGPTQFIYSATFGTALDEDWKLAGTLSGVSSSSNFIPLTSDGINRDFSYFRIALGLGRKVSKTTQVYASIYQDVTGKNIGRGSGFSLYAVIHL
jgi:protein XagA